MQVSRIVSLSSSIVRHHRVLYSTSRGFSVPRAKLPEVPPQPLPSLFASVQSITQADIDHYVAPLFDWNWRVFMEMPNLILSENSLERAARNVPMLGKKFWFLRSRAAANFLVDVVDLAGKEKHDPRITLFLGKMKQHVVVRMHTPRTLEVADALSEENVQPGLSASDVRLAIRLENLFQDKYVASKKALPLPHLLPTPHVPALDKVLARRTWETARSAATIKADATWTPISFEEISPLPPSPALEDADRICTNHDFDMFLLPLYSRGWHAAFMPIIGKDKLYAPTLCLTGFFRFSNIAAAISFIRDIVAFPWYREDSAELHFLIDAQTVRAQLVYAPEHDALTLGNIRAALRIERIFHDKYVGSARMSLVHPYRSGKKHQPTTLEELEQTRETPLRMFHVRHNAKMGRVKR